MQMRRCWNSGRTRARSLNGCRPSSHRRLQQDVYPVRSPEGVHAVRHARRNVDEIIHVDFDPVAIELHDAATGEGEDQYPRLFLDRHRHGPARCHDGVLEPQTLQQAGEVEHGGAAQLVEAAAVAAQGWIEPIMPVPLPSAPRGGIDKVRSAVQVSVSGRVARVTVEEWFRNNGPMLGEGNYLYPLPGEAVYSDFSLWQGDRELKGEPMDAAQARAIYEEIVRRKRDPALIELAGHGLLRARVFQIGPGETRKITLRYTQMLDRVGDAWRFRYTAGTGTGAAASSSFRMQVDSAARFGDPYSPTHRLSTSRSDDRILLTLADTSTHGDLELFLPLTRNLVGMSLVTSQPVGEDGFFMLLLT